MRTSVRWFVATSLSLLAIWLFAVGCSTPKAKEDPNQWSLNPAWRVHSLYSAAAPHDSIYVEVDCVEGLDPRPETLAALQAFLETYCDKPGGIRIERSSRIPRNIARLHFRQELALQYMDGPPRATNRPGPAYMYILVYDSTLEPRARPAFITRTAAALPPQQNWPEYNGHVDYLPYPAAVFVHGRAHGAETERSVLLHEVGHLLGPRPDRTYHCDSRKCMMNASLIAPIHSLLLFQDRIKNTNLCDRCRAGLLEARTNAAPGNLRFHGSWLTRNETNYSIWSLPKVALVVPGGAAEKDLPNELKPIKALAQNLFPRIGTNREGALITGAWWDNNNPGPTRAALTNALNDWYKPIRDRAAEELEKKPESRKPDQQRP